jgi:acyl-CoA thioesterase
MTSISHPFAELIGLKHERRPLGQSLTRLTIDPKLHHNPQRATHGAVLFALADTGMGAALYPSLEKGQFCATVEVKISYIGAVRDGEVVCETRTVSKGKRVAFLESDIYNDGKLVAKATGTYSIFEAKL